MNYAHQIQNNSYTPLIWWHEFADEMPILSAFAIKIFSLVVSTSTVEQSFKLQGNMHTKTRNRLKHETCRKLMSIKMNCSILNSSQSNKRKITERLDHLENEVIAIESSSDEDDSESNDTVYDGVGNGEEDLED